jgi:hypothetical protein
MISKMFYKSWLVFTATFLFLFCLLEFYYEDFARTQNMPYAFRIAKKLEIPGREANRVALFIAVAITNVNELTIWDHSVRLILFFLILTCSIACGYIGALSWRIIRLRFT